MNMNDWWRYKGDGQIHAESLELPPPPPWRQFSGQPDYYRFLDLMSPEDQERGRTYKVTDRERDLVNTALFLRRPLLITGKPGVGKSSLAYSVAYELNLGPVLHWPITSRTTLQEGLYRYDAIARLQETSLNKHGKAPSIGDFVRLGPLGTAMIPAKRPRVLLIDEIDKSDIDLPNDLLDIFEEGRFEIPELARVADEEGEIEVRPYDGAGRVTLRRGWLQCMEFPLVFMTSNGEREFPPAFLRRCLRLTIQPPGLTDLEAIVEARLRPSGETRQELDMLIHRFLERRDGGDHHELATDQLLNAIYMVLQGVSPLQREELLNVLLRPLNRTDDNY